MLRSISTGRTLLVQNRVTVKRLLIAATLFAALAAPAHAASVSVVVVPPFDPQTYAEREEPSGCSSRARARPSAGRAPSPRSSAARSRPSVLGGTPSGKPLIALGRHPADVTVYVALPPAGRHSNTQALPDRDRRRRLPRDPHLARRRGSAGSSRSPTSRRRRSPSSRGSARESARHPDGQAAAHLARLDQPDDPDARRAALGDADPRRLGAGRSAARVRVPFRVPRPRRAGRGSGGARRRRCSSPRSRSRGRASSHRCSSG